MIYNDKRNYPVEIDDSIDKEFLTLTARADISVKEEEAAVKVDISDITRNVVLNSNITVHHVAHLCFNGSVPLWRGICTRA